MAAMSFCAGWPIPWFQSFGAVMGMDWHSSGITTSVIGALKRGLTPLSGELGIHVWTALWVQGQCCRIDDGYECGHVSGLAVRSR
jgi:Protein of unknown function (DUF763)